MDRSLGGKLSLLAAGAAALPRAKEKRKKTSICAFVATDALATSTQGRSEEGTSLRNSKQMSEEKDLLAVLTTAGYVGDTKNLGWAMRLKHMKALVAFLSKCAPTALSGAELSAFRVLESKGKVRKDAVAPGSTVSLLRDENADLALRLQRLEERRQTAEAQCEVLRGEVGRCRERAAKRKKMTGKNETGIEAKNERINEQVAHVAQQCRDLIGLHRSEAAMMCVNALEPYVGQEEQCAREARRLLERLFGSAEQASAQQRRTLEQRAATQEELARLQQSLVVGGMARARAAAEHEKSGARPPGKAGSKTELQMQVAVLRRQTEAAADALKDALEEAAQVRTWRVTQADCAARSEALKGQLARARSVLALLQAQQRRQTQLVCAMQGERMAVRHVANLLRTLLEALEGANAAHIRCMLFWKALREHGGTGGGALADCVQRCIEAAMGSGSGATAEGLAAAARAGREARAQSEHAAAAAVARAERAAAQWGPAVRTEGAAESEAQRAAKRLGEATALLCLVEKQRLAAETEARARNAEVVAMERALMPLFWENPKDPEKLNQKLAALKDRLAKK